jgi:hypothetical protein
MSSLGKSQMLGEQASHIIIIYRLLLFAFAYRSFVQTINKIVKKRNQFLKSITTSIKMLL